jgi:ABC-type cobalamin transport system ATPase subunit
MDCYQVNLSDEVHRSIRRLPGHVRQRIVRAIQALQQEPRPHNSRAMDMTTSTVNLAPDMEARRIRMADWSNLRTAPITT